MYQAPEAIPLQEIRRRHDAVRTHLATVAPRAGGILVFSRLNVYYLTGTFGQGVLWLPAEGEPVLMLRKGVDRANIETVGCTVRAFKSYSELASICADAGSPLSPVMAAVKGGLTWQLGEMLQAKLKGHELIPGDHALALARMVKSEFELEIMRAVGAAHHHSLYDLLPTVIRPGMTERDISHKAWEVFFSQGHQGVLRMQAHGEECFLGHVSAGDSGNYPSAFNGPLGLRGEHPAAPVMGSVHRVWEHGMPLSLDIGFQMGGYHSDKTQIYFAGRADRMPDRMRRGHDFCVEMQQWICDTAKPGVTPAELYDGVVRQAEAAGWAEGFMGLGENKVPFIGHGIGLAIDEFPPLAAGFDLPLQAGMTLALEPKQGIPGLGMVGVENTFEVTASGCRCLSGDRYDIVCIE